MNNKKFIYKAFFRPNPPSILRLACIQLISEGIDFSKEDVGIVWELILNRAKCIVHKISTTKKAKKLHRELLNER